MASPMTEPLNREGLGSSAKTPIPTAPASTPVLDLVGLTVSLVSDTVNGGLCIRKWTNDGLEPGTHQLIVKCLAEREVARLLTALRFYADDHTNPNDGPWGVSSTDFGNRAREVIAEITGAAK